LVVKIEFLCVRIHDIKANELLFPIVAPVINRFRHLGFVHSAGIADKGKWKANLKAAELKKINLKLRG